MVFHIGPAHALVVFSTLFVPHVYGAKLKGPDDTSKSLAASASRRLQSDTTSDWGLLVELFSTYARTIKFSGEGKRIVVGNPYAPRDDADTNNNFGTGFVQVFEQVEGTVSWNQIGGDIDGASGNDLFGKEVSISANGDRIAVVAPEYDVGEEDYDYDYYGSEVIGGRLRVFDYNIDSNWTEVGALLDVKAAIMSSNGQRFVVGQTDEVGRAGVFELNGNEFEQLGSWIDADVAGDSFGERVAINDDGTRIAVGAQLHDDNGFDVDDYDYYYGFPSCYDSNDDDAANFGLVRAYQFSSGAWIQMGEDILGEACEKFGASIDMSDDGTRIVVGAPEAEVFDVTTTSGSMDDATEAGSVRVLDFIDDSWTDVGNKIEGTYRLSLIGDSVAISASGDRIVVGSANTWLPDINEYPICIYELVDEVWETVGECIQRGVDADCSNVAMDSTGEVVGVTCNGIEQLNGIVTDVGVMVYSLMNECVAEQNDMRLQTVAELVVEHNENEENLESQHIIARRRIRREAQEEWIECEDQECQDEVVKQARRALRMNDATFENLSEMNTENFFIEEESAGAQFLMDSEMCE